MTYEDPFDDSDSGYSWDPFDDSDSGYSWEGVGQALHTYDPAPGSNRCRGGWYNERGEWIKCGSTQRSSVLHDDEEAMERERHWHGGGDCMCFEDY